MKEPKSEPQAPVEIQLMTDSLMKCVLAYKETREETFLTDMADLSRAIRARGYHPYFMAKGEILIVSREPMTPPIVNHTDDERFDA
jgi:hypothetical protein